MKTLCAFLLAAGCLLAQSAQQQALVGFQATCCSFYVSQSTGNDSNPGTLASPWQTIAKVNAQTLSAGQSIGFKAGDTWREQLTVPNSGSAGLPIVFTSYGSGAPPIISGATILTSFTQLPANPTGSVSQSNMRLSLVNGTAFVDFGVTASLTPYIGNLITITDSSAHTITGYIKAAGTGETYGTQLLSNPSLNTTTGITAFFASTITSVAGGFIGNALQVATTAAFGNAGQYVVGPGTAKGMLIKNSSYMEKGTESVSLCLNSEDSSFVGLNTVCGLPATWTQFSVYAVDDDAAGYMVQSYESVTSGKTSLFNTASAQQVLAPSSTGVTITSTSGGSAFNWASINASFNYNDPGGYTYAITGTSPVWSKTVATQPKVLNFAGTMGVPQATLSTVTSVYAWSYTGTTLYVYSPSTEPGALYSPLNAGQRDFGIVANPHSYITISGLQIQFANNTGIGFFGASNNITVTNSVVTGNYYFGIDLNDNSTGTNNCSLLNNTASWNGSTGIFVGSIASNCTLANNTAFNNAWGGNWTVDANFDAGCGVRMFGGGVSNNNTIASNVSYNNGLGPTGIWNTQGNNQSPPDQEDGGGVMLDTMGTGNIMEFNTAYNNEVAGLRVEADTSSLVYGNVSYGNVQNIELAGYSGMGMDLGFGINGTKVYNNTMYGNRIGVNVQGDVSASKNVTNLLFKNNLATNSVTSDLTAKVGGNNDGVNGSGNVYTFNGFGPAATSFIQWATGTFFSTYATWEAATGNCGTTGCSHSMQSDPLFTNPGAGDFTLQMGSPAINAGTCIMGVTPCPTNIGSK